MISKGTTHNNGARLAAYMTTGKDGEKAELWQLRGFEATNIKDAFRDVQIMARGTKAEQPFFHVQVRNREGERLTREQWEYAADRIEKMLGLGGQPRAIAFHTFTRNGDEHMHVAWSRIDQDTMKAIPLPFFKDRLKKISRELEKEFGLEPVTNRREGNIRFAPTRAEQEQATRLGLGIHEVRNSIRDCWDRSDCGRSFLSALDHEGLILARGEKRDYVVIDRAGGVHALGKRILDMTAAKIRERLSDISRDELPSAEIAQAYVRDLAPEKRPLKEKAAPSWDRDRDDRAWQDAVINAAIDKEKTARNFVEPGPERAGVGSRKEEWFVRPAAPEPARAPQIVRIETGRKDAKKKGRGFAPRMGKEARAAISVSYAAGRTVAKTLDAASDAFASLFAPTLTPEQIREGENAARRREAEAEASIDFARYTADRAQQRRQQEQDIEAARQRLRDEVGRER
jgi:hypothetical protein